MTKSLTFSSRTREKSISIYFNALLGFVYDLNFLVIILLYFLIETPASVALKEDEIINHRVLVAQPQPQTPEKELTVLDELVIDTSLNISDKICTSAINVMLLATKKFSVVDEDILLNVETLSYILEDSHIQTDEKEKQLSALLKNMKKLEHALALTDRILNNTETTKQ